MRDIIRSLFSVKNASKKGIDCLITNYSTRVFLKRDRKIIATGSKYGNLIKLDIIVVIPKECNLTEQNVEYLDRKLYSVTFEDEFSGFREIHFVREKSEVG